MAYFWAFVVFYEKRKAYEDKSINLDVLNDL